MKLIDLTGKKFGRWTVIGMSEKRTHNHVYWNCFCECGTRKTIYGECLRSGTSKSCGCYKKDTDRDKMFHDYTGERIGRLVVLEQTEPLNTPGGKKMRKWKIKCDCGVQKIIQTQTLRKQKKTGFVSCGCWSKERNREERMKYIRPYECYLNRIKSSAYNRNKSKGRNKILVNIDYSDLIKIIPESGDGKCHYCNESIFWDKYEKSKNNKQRKTGHNFDRKDNSKGYEIGNLLGC